MTVMHCFFIQLDSIVSHLKSTHLDYHKGNCTWHKHIPCFFYTKHRLDDSPKYNQYPEAYHQLKTINSITNFPTNTTKLCSHMSPPKAVYREFRPHLYLQSNRHRYHWSLFDCRIQVLTRWIESNKRQSNPVRCHLLSVLDWLKKKRK